MGGDTNQPRMTKPATGAAPSSQSGTESVGASFAAKRRGMFMDVIRPSSVKASPTASPARPEPTNHTSPPLRTHATMDIKPPKTYDPTFARQTPTPPPVITPSTDARPMSGMTPDLHENGGAPIIMPAANRSTDEPMQPSGPTPQTEPADESRHDDESAHDTATSNDAPAPDATAVSFLDREDTGQPSGITEQPADTFDQAASQPNSAEMHAELAEIYPQLAEKLSNQSNDPTRGYYAETAQTTIASEKHYVDTAPNYDGNSQEPERGIGMPEDDAESSEPTDEIIERTPEPTIPTSSEQPFVEPVEDTAQTVDAAPEPTETPEPEAQPEPATVEQDVPEEAPDQPTPADQHEDEEDEQLDSFVASVGTQPLNSPFLPNAKVEKRPLGPMPLKQEELTEDDLKPDTEPPVDESQDDEDRHDVDGQGEGGEPVEQPTEESSTDTPTPEDSSAPDETPREPADSLLAQLDTPDEQTTHDDTPQLAAQPTDDNAPVPEGSEVMDLDDSLPARTQDTAPLRMTLSGSIPQQYSVSPSTGDTTNGAIYDTDQYHQPIAARRHADLMFWAIWIIVILMLGAVVGAGYYYISNT